MSWLGAEVDGSLIVTRTVHFAASVSLAGALMFRGLVAEPALRAVPPAAALVRKQVRGVAWIGLAVALVSGLILVLLLTMSLSGESLGEAVMSGALRDAQLDAIWIGVAGPLGARDRAGDLSGL
jgi:copper resistance protein D